MASKKKWKKRALKAEADRSVDQVLSFERASNLEGQLRAIDHIILQRELPGPTQDEWVIQARTMLQDLVRCRQEQRVDGFTAEDVRQLKHSYFYPEHFAPSTEVPPGATRVSNEHAQSIVRALIQEWPNATRS